MRVLFTDYLKGTLTSYSISLSGLLFLSIFLIMSAECSAQQAEKRLLSPEKVLSPGEIPENWNRNWWGDSTNYATAASPRSDNAALVLQSDILTSARYHRQVPLTPNSTYQLSYWIKTEDVKGKRGGGAGVRLGKLSFSPDTVFRNSSDWIHRTVTFSVKDDDSMVLEVLLGKGGPAKGRVLIDEIYLKRLSHSPFDPSVTLDLGEKRAPMSKYIYGQFIEHMGQSIYGGIWAEMLEDRKFYFVPNAIKSPWEFKAEEPSQLVIDSLDAYVGEYSPLLRATADSKPELFQEGLALEKSRKYSGRIILSGNPSILPVDVILSWGEGKDKREVVHINKISRSYQSHKFNFEVGADTENGRLTIVPRGEGVLHVGTLSLMPADNISGFRPDVIALMKRLNAPVYRWPGGNFVSGYNWKDGVGKRDKRPPRVDRAWLSQYEKPWDAIEHNDVGIHEFMKLCEILDSEPFIAVNTGLGTAKLAAEEVQYLNGKRTTEMGQWRARNGHSRPFDVRFFAVGNEMFGEWQLGHMPLERYVKKHNRFARAMWEVDPDIDLVAVGASGEWNKQMYKHSSEYMTYISEHFYRQNWHGGGLMTHVKQISEAIKDIADEHRMWRKKLDALDGDNIKIALDEWNYWYGPHVYGLLGTRYFLRDALGIAAGINAYLRNSDIIYMANYAQTVNVIGAIKATQTESFMAATGVVLETYRKRFGYIPVKTTGDKLPFDIASALSRDGKYLTVSVVNPTRKDQQLGLNITGGKINSSGKAFIITGKHDMVYNEVGNEKAVSSRQQPIEIVNNRVTIPAMSATILRFEVR